MCNSILTVKHIQSIPCYKIIRYYHLLAVQSEQLCSICQLYMRSGTGADFLPKRTKNTFQQVTNYERQHMSYSQIASERPAVQQKYRRYFRPAYSVSQRIQKYV
jgi:hypothetical protein